MEARLISPAGAASLSMTEIRDAAARDGGTLWLDFDHTDEDSMALLGELIDVRPSDIQECHNRSPVPKMRFYADHHFSAINGLARGSDGRLYFQPLKLFLTPRGIGHRARPDEFVVDIGDRATRARRRAPADRQRAASSGQFVRARRRDSGRRDADARGSDHRVLGSYRTAGT